MKQTVEAAAREYSNDQRNRQHHCEPYCIVDFKSGAEWHAKQSPWISVYKKMPPLGQKVIHMNINTSNVNVGQVNKVGIFVLGYTYVGEVEVTHWMPIPSLNENP